MTRRAHNKSKECHQYTTATEVMNRAQRNAKSAIAKGSAKRMPARVLTTNWENPATNEQSLAWPGPGHDFLKDGRVPCTELIGLRMYRPLGFRIL